jgi:transcriptional regulator with XRE-family HTH domain
MNEFEKKVRKALIDRDMTARDLANELGISVSYISEILKGTRKADAQKTRIMEFLGIGDDEDEQDDC